ncbi:hypothetical protein BG004_000213 [Podila humilis]|nr:hypothetical protein BG004_000213 [Podila humilis]
MPKVAKKETKVTKRSKAVEEPKKKKRRAKKDPNAPKNPLSAYLLFCEDWREKPYNKKHEAAKAKYVVEKAAYDAKKSSGGDSDEEEEEEESD